MNHLDFNSNHSRDELLRFIMIHKRLHTSGVIGDILMADLRNSFHSTISLLLELDDPRLRLLGLGLNCFNGHNNGYLFDYILGYAWITKPARSPSGISIVNLHGNEMIFAPWIYYNNSVHKLEQETLSSIIGIIYGHIYLVTEKIRF